MNHTHRYLLYFILLFAFSNLVKAQEKFKILPKFGVNLQSLSGDGENEYEARVGYQVGIDFRIGANTYIEPGVHFLATTSNIIPDPANTAVSDDNLDFTNKGLRIPLMIGYDFFDEGGLGLRFFGGPSFTFILDKDEPIQDILNIDQKSSALGLNAGIGFDLGIFTIDLAHEWNINKNIEIDNIQVNKRAVFLSAGLIF